MYQYHSGEVRNPGFESMLILVRVFIFLFVVVVAGAAGTAAGLPAFAGGTLGALAVLAFFVCRPFFEVVNYTCPHCGNQVRTIKNFGAYRCSSCGGESRI